MNFTQFKRILGYQRFYKILLVVGAIALLAAEDSYVREIQQWRQEQDQFLRSAKGPLLLVARYNIDEGDSTVGSRPGSKVLLPEKAPGRVCTIQRHGADISLLPTSETQVAVNGNPVSGDIRLKAVAGPAPADRVGFGDFTFAIRPVGQEFYLFLADKQSNFLRDFHGKTWFSIDPAYRVTAQFTPYGHPKTLDVADTTGSTRTYSAPGQLVFSLGGETLRLEPLGSGDELLVMFRDRTSGIETYGGGRFLQAAMPRQGQTVLDFNKAYNPYCAFNPNAACPVPQKENRLPVRVPAGETYTAHH
jgi:uncharacterized protein